MSGVVSEQFGLMIPHGRLEACIASLEDGLRALSPTPYHAVLGRSFLHQLQQAAEYIAGFHRDASGEIKVRALYFEMNGFAINPKRWYCDGFAYANAGDIWDLEWLADWQAQTQEQLTLTGMEPVQDAFEGVYSDHSQPLAVRLAGELAEHLVTARFMQLFAEAHEVAKHKYRHLEKVPVFSTTHEWDTVHMTK